MGGRAKAAGSPKIFLGEGGNLVLRRLLSMGGSLPLGVTVRREGEVAVGVGGVAGIVVWLQISSTSLSEVMKMSTGEEEGLSGVLGTVRRFLLRPLT